MRDSRWFIAVEREGLQNLLTERKVARALEVPAAQVQGLALPPLASASILLEGGIVAFESNVRTGGEGVNFLGVGVNEQYRVDQVTVNMRAVDVRSGQIINSVSTTKTIFSQQINSNLYRFVNFKDLLQAEVGFTRNEPTQMCVSSAIEAALVQLILQGAHDGVWLLQNPNELNTNPLFPFYLNEVSEQLRPSKDMARKEEVVRSGSAKTEAVNGGMVRENPVKSSAAAVTNVWFGH
jgi:curli production assembly/transport component CsgG